MISLLDIVIVIVLLGSVAYGIWKGFVRIAVGVAGLLLSLAVSLRLAEQGPVWFPEVFKSDHLARAAAFLSVLLLGLLFTAMIAWLAFRLVQAAQIGWVDRLIGGSIGLAGGMLVVAAALVGMVSFLPAGSSVIKHSTSVHAVLTIVDAAANILPPKMAETYKERRRALDA